MPYRFYLMSLLGIRSTPEDIDCSSDFAAMMQAQGLLVSGSSVEVWLKGRLVGEIGMSFSRWGSKTPASQPAVLR